MNYPQQNYFGQQGQNPTNGLHPPRQTLGQQQPANGFSHAGSVNLSQIGGLSGHPANSNLHPTMSHVNHGVYSGANGFPANSSGFSSQSVQTMNHSQHVHTQVQHSQASMHKQPQQVQGRYQGAPVMPHQALSPPGGCSQTHYKNLQANNYSRQQPGTSSVNYSQYSNHSQNSFSQPTHFGQHWPNPPQPSGTPNFHIRQANYPINLPNRHQITQAHSTAFMTNSQIRAQTQQQNPVSPYATQSNIYSAPNQVDSNKESANTHTSSSISSRIQYQNRMLPSHNIMGPPPRKASNGGVSGGIVNLASFYHQQPLPFSSSTQISDNILNSGIYNNVHPYPTQDPYQQPQQTYIPEYPIFSASQIQNNPPESSQDNTIEVANQYKYIEELLSYLTSLLEHPSLIGDVQGDWLAKKEHIIKFKETLQQNMKRSLSSCPANTFGPVSFLPQEKMHLLIIQLKKLIVGLETKIPQIDTSESNSICINSFEKSVAFISNNAVEFPKTDGSWDVFADLDDLLGIESLPSPPKPFYIYPFEKTTSEVQSDSSVWILGMNFQCLLLCLEKMENSEFCVKQVINTLSEFKEISVSTNLENSKNFYCGDLTKICDYYLSLLAVPVP